MQLNFKFNINLETERVEYTLKKLDWYLDNNYNPRLPKKISKNSKQTAIVSSIKREYDAERYEKIKNAIKKDFYLIKQEYNKQLIKTFGPNIITKMNIILTNYGVGGSYMLPNTIIFNINNKVNIKALIHESMHLVIEPFIKTYNIQHWEKERIIDLILNSDKFKFLKYNHWQKNYHGVGIYLDSLFKKYFLKSTEKFFEKIEKAREK